MVRVPFNEVINYWLPSYVVLLEHAHVAPFGPKVNKNQRTRVFKFSKKDCHQFSKIQ